jgi:hypothetical protein
MKTPREILFNRHASTNEKLDAIREEAVRAAADVNRTGAPGRELNLATAFLRALMFSRDLLWPAPKAWAGLAAVWILILAMQFAARDHSQTVAKNTAPPSPEVILALKSQEQLMAELVGTPETRDANRSKNLVPRPRSERQEKQQTA